MPLCSAILAAAVAAQSASPDSLRLLARKLPDSALAAEARLHPLAVREALGETLTRAVRGARSAREQELAAARRFAEALAVAWGDSFPLRQVARFTGWPPERRAAKVWADSVRRAGIAAFGRDGPVAAIAIWRRGLSRSTAIGDTAGAAPTSSGRAASPARSETCGSRRTPWGSWRA